MITSNIVNNGITIILEVYFKGSPPKSTNYYTTFGKSYKIHTFFRCFICYVLIYSNMRFTLLNF